MFLEMNVILIIDVFGLLFIVLFADEAFFMSSISKMSFELINIIKPFSTIVTIGMINDDLSIFTVFSFFQVRFEFEFSVESMLRGKTFSIIKTYVTSLKKELPELLSMDFIEVFFELIHIGGNVKTFRAEI